MGRRWVDKQFTRKAPGEEISELVSILAADDKAVVVFTCFASISDLLLLCIRAYVYVHVSCFGIH